MASKEVRPQSESAAAVVSVAPIARVWINTSAINSSFIDYRWRGVDMRMVVLPLVGVRLPKDVESIAATGHGMKAVETGATADV
jgi:hypothetical protein